MGSRKRCQINPLYHKTSTVERLETRNQVTGYSPRLPLLQSNITRARSKTCNQQSSCLRVTSLVTRNCNQRQFVIEQFG